MDRLDLIGAVFIIVSDALFRFRQRWPQVHIQMRAINSRQQRAPLHEGRPDPGVMRNTPPPADLRHARLLREPRMT